MIENISWDDGEHMSVSEIVNASYSTGFKFYRYSALLFNFLNETQPQTIIDLHKIIRSDDVTAFDHAVESFANDAQLQTDYADYLRIDPFSLIYRLLSSSDEVCNRIVT